MNTPSTKSLKRLLPPNSFQTMISASETVRCPLSYAGFQLVLCLSEFAVS